MIRGRGRPVPFVHHMQNCLPLRLGSRKRCAPPCIYYSVARKEMVLSVSQVSSCWALHASRPRYYTSREQAPSPDVWTNKLKDYAPKEDKTIGAAWLWAMSDPRELLQRALKRAKTAKHLYLILIRLGSLHEEASDRDAFRRAVVADVKFKQLCESLEKLSSQLSSSELLSTVQTLSRLPPTDRSVILSVENELLWKMKDMTAVELGTILKASRLQFSEEQRTKIFSVACNNLVQKANEVNSGKEWTIIVQQLGQFSAHNTPENRELWDKVEARLLQLFEPPTFRAKDITYIMTVMGFCKRRNLPLLHRMSEHLNAKPLHEFLTVKQLAKLAETCCTLSFFDEKLLQAVGDAVVAKLEYLNHVQEVEADLSSLMHSFGIMRCRHIKALDKLCTLLLNRNEQGSLSKFSLLNVLMTCSTVSYVPLSLQERFPEVMATLRSQETDNPKLWLDVVWSTAVLQHCTAEMAESVLKAGFLTSLQEKGLLQSPPVQLKLLNINKVADVDIQSYSGSRLPGDFIKNYNVTVPQRVKQQTLESVMKAIGNMAPSEKFTKKDVWTPLGYILDAELLVNNEGLVQQLTLHGTMFNDDGSVNGMDSLPKGLHRVAIKVLDFPDLTLCTVHPTGLHMMALRYLRTLGYKVVVIPHNEFKTKNHVVKQVQYLQERIRHALRNGGEGETWMQKK